MTRCEARRISLAALVCAAAVSGRAPAARAQAEDQAAARALFAEGRALMKAGQYADACPKLEAARKLFTSAGILLNLADCHEKIGRTASAWTEFGEAAAVAKRTNRDDDAEEATRRQGALEPSLPRLTIRVAHAVPGLGVKRDGAPIAPAAWGAALPVDPGAHEIRAEAAGFEPWIGSATVSTPGQVVTVDVPELHATLGATAPAAGRVKPVLVTVVPSETSPADNVLPWALIGGGGAVAAGGVVLMLVEASHASDARTNHDPAAYDAAKTPWTVGLVGALVGVASAGVGVALLVTHPSESAPAGPSVSAWWGGGSSGGLLLAGRW
ncbi:MAG TPA: tetratricopeptide repeat protein [Polyangia bacterium]|nr:tetratricopeptide repeat protein [Polyangia bacterium]